MTDNGNSIKPGRPKGTKKTRVKFNNKNAVIVSKTGIELEECWCRKCMAFKSARDFYDATDTFLDSNGKMSICRDCINDLFVNVLQSEIDVYRTFLRVCRTLNIIYDEPAIDATLKQRDENDRNGKQTDYIFGIYKGRISSLAKSGGKFGKGENLSLTFVEPTVNNIINPITEDDDEDTVDVKIKWGTNYTDDDYDYLEAELADWMKTHKCDTKAEMTLLKEICHLSLQIRKDRVEGKDVSKKVKELQDLMKTANVDPAKTAIAGGGQSQDTFSSFIKTIEQNRPAEYYKDKQLFKDFDNLNWYFKKFITRPLSNFLQITKDFNLEDDNDNDDEIYDVIENEVET